MTRHGVTLLSPRPKVPTRVMGRVDCESSVTQTKRAPKPAEANWHERLERRGLSPPMPRILVSYRRADTAYLATTIHEKLAQAFGLENVFMDVNAIPAGRDFRKHLEQAVASCDVVLAVIDERWLDAREAAGRRRLDLPTDWVRIELETALARDIPVIPLLVAGARTPVEAELPESLRELAYRQALLLRPGRDFQHDLDMLRREIERTCRAETEEERRDHGQGAALRPDEGARERRAAAAAGQHDAVPGQRREPSRWRAPLLVTAAMVLSGLVGVIVLAVVRRDHPEPKQAPVAAATPGPAPGAAVE